jgi:hypothetical protein
LCPVFQTMKDDIQLSTFATHFTTFLPRFNHHQRRHFLKTPLKTQQTNKKRLSPPS